jgi:hypothetical protein
MQTYLSRAQVVQEKIQRIDLSGFKLLAVFALLAGLSTVFVSPLLTSLGLVVYFTFLVVFASTNPISFIIALPLIGLWVTEIISVYAIEMGAFMQEVGSAGSMTGATIRLGLLHVLVLATASHVSFVRDAQACTFSILNAAAYFKHKKPFLWIVVAASSLYLIILLLTGFQNGFPLLTGTDRLTYRAAIEDPVFMSAINNRPVIIGMIGVLYLMGYRYVSVALVAAFIGVSILFSEKFTSLVLMIGGFSIPFLLITIAKNGYLNLKVFVLPLLAAAAITTPVILTVYSAGGDQGGAVEKTLERFALQGQMWFVVDKDFFSYWNFDAASVSAEMKSWIGLIDQDSESVGTLFGRFYVMQHYVENDLLRYMIQYDQGYVFTLMPSWLASGGYLWAALMSSCAGVVVGAIARLTVSSLVQGDYVGQVVLNKAMLTVISGIISGYSYQLFGYKIFGYLVMALALTMLFKRRESRAR